MASGIEAGAAAGNQEVLTEAYLYGFPLVFNLEQVHRYVTAGVGSNPAAPFNAFSHARAPGRRTRW